MAELKSFFLSALTPFISAASASLFVVWPDMPKAQVKTKKILRLNNLRILHLGIK
jgi:hypothetical protein